MKNPRILVAAPVYDVMKYCIKDFLKRIKELDYEDYDILLVDNSRENYFFEELKEEEGIIVLKDETLEEKNKLRLVSSRNKIIDFAKTGGYEYLLMMDSDVIPPKSIITDLLKEKKEIISGLYYNYFIVNGEPKFMPVAWCSLNHKEFEQIKLKVQLPPIVKSCKDLRRHITSQEFERGETIEVKIPSAGCILISRKVFEKIKYGLLDKPEVKSTTDDVYFCIKAAEAGFKLYCKPSVKCDHLIRGKFYKDKEGSLKHPMYD